MSEKLRSDNSKNKMVPERERETQKREREKVGDTIIHWPKVCQGKH